MALDIYAEFEKRHKPRAGRTLVVGSRVYGEREDRRKRYADAVGVDMLAGDGVDVVADLEDFEYDAESLCLGYFSHVDCLSVLEHCKAPWVVAHKIEWFMAEGATLMLSVPFVWWVHAYPNDYWRMTTEAVRSIFPRIKWDELVYAHTSFAEGGKIPSVFKDEHRYFARTEVLGFGVRV